jgi:hypothetical protein
MSRWENAPTRREVVRMTYAMVDVYCASYRRPPAAVTLDIDDTVDVVHGHQQLSLFNAHYDARCFLPIHVYDTATSRPVAVVLRPGKTPSGCEVRGYLRRLVRRIRGHWPMTRLTIRGDGHYGRPEVMAWCEANAVDDIFGVPGNTALSRSVEAAADDVRVRRAEAAAPVLRRYAETRYAAKSWTRERRVAARIEASTQGLDIRFVVTNLERGSAEWLYNTLYCARGQAENPGLRRGRLRSSCTRASSSDRTSCRSPLANQVRLVLHTAASWLMLTVRDAIPKPQALATAEFITLRMPSAQDRRPHHRDRDTRPHRLRRGVPRSRIVPRHRAQPPTRRTLTHGAIAPELTLPQPRRPSPPDRNRDEIGAKPTHARRSDSKTSLNAVNQRG